MQDGGGQAITVLAGALLALGGFTGYLIRYILTQASKQSERDQALNREVLSPLIESQKAVSGGLDKLTAEIRLDRQSRERWQDEPEGPRIARRPRTEGRTP